MTYLTLPLSGSHKKKTFSCGNKQLDDYLHHQARQDIKRHLSACFVLADEDNTVKGYYTLSSASIPRPDLPDQFIKKLPPAYLHLPATLLGRLAVDSTYKGKGLGELLLLDALRRSHDVSREEIASLAVIVDPVDEDAKRFYLKYGFILLPDSGKMFMSMNTIVELFK